MIKCICGKMNAYHCRYCVYCGKKLKTPPSWSMGGCTANRTSMYPAFSGLSFKGARITHDIFFKDSLGANMPHALFANGRFWCWDIARQNLVNFPLIGLNGNFHAEKGQSVQIGINGTQDYSSTPVFDGICINFLADGQFFRVSTIENRLAGKQLQDPVFSQTQKAAPLYGSIANPQNAGRPFRFILLSLKHHVLLVDISVKGEEKYSLLEWNNEDEQDEMRSPVAYKNWVYFTTKQGKVYHLNMAAGPDDIQSRKKLKHLTLPFDRYCMAPMVVSDHLVMQTVHKSSLTQSEDPDKSWHKTAITCIPLTDSGDLGENIQETFIKSPIRLGQLEESGHLANLSDGYGVYAKADGNGAMCRVLPGKGGTVTNISWDERDGVIPDFSCHNALFIGNHMYVVDNQRSRLLGWNMKNEKYLGIVNALGFSEPLLSQPVAYANILALLFKQYLLFIEL